MKFILVCLISKFWRFDPDELRARQTYRFDPNDVTQHSLSVHAQARDTLSRNQ
jgi:hypothetical protein